MAQTRVKPMVEGGVLAAVAIVFALISAYIPLIGPFVNLIWPVPIILLGVRHGYKWSIMATVVAGALIAIMMHPLHAVSIVIGFGLIGIVLGHAFRAGFTPVKALLWGSAASLVSKIAVLAIGAVFLGVNPLNIQTEAMDKAIFQALEFYGTMGMKEDELAKMGETMRTLIGMMKIILPAGFTLAAIIDTYLNFVVAKAVLRKLGHHIEAFPAFKEWNMPRWTIYAFALALGMVWYGQANQLALVANIGMNLQVITTLLLLVQGMALIYYLADKYNLSRLVKGIILFLIFSNGLFLQIVVFAGAFDIALDYRQLRAPRTL